MNTEVWLAKLIAFDTTSCNSNLTLIECVGNWLADHQIAFTLTHDSTKTKANLFATLPASDGSLNGGLILSGHTDVVPVIGQAWDSDPFIATKKDNRIYGRGTCDMKGFLAVVLALIPELQNTPRKQPVHLAFSYDEEVGCLGAPLLIADFQVKGIQPSACIVGEPTEMIPVVAHKGINSFRCRVHGHAAHSSLTPKGCNAIEYGAKLICWLRNYAEQLKEGSKDERYDVPYTTLTNNMISGGIALNTIPDYLEFIYEFRNLPHDNPDQISQIITDYVKTQLIPEMQKEYQNASVEIEPINLIPAFEASENMEWISKDTIKKVSYATEAGLFQKANIPTIVCGPGSITEAHKANEFVTVEQLNACENFLRKVIR